MKIIKTAAIVVAAVTLAVVTAGVASGASVGFAFAALASTVGVSTAVLGGVVALGAVAALQKILPTPSAGSQTKWKADPYAGVPYVMGRTLVSGNIVGKRGSGGNNTYEHFVTILSGGGPINAIEASFANRTTIDFDANGTASGTYNDLIWQKQQLGACPEAAALAPARGAFPGWDATSKLSGMAATLVTMEYDASGKHQLSTEPQMAWIIQGVLVYDPRLDSTYSGGSGACRALDESTYVYSENPHLHALTWALGRFQNGGKRVCGIGAKIAEIDVASFVEGANLDDARGWKIGGQVVTRPDTPWASLKSMLQAGGAQPTLVGGKIVSINQAPRVSLDTITHADIVGDCSFAGTQPRRTRINGVIPMYRSEAHDWEYVTAGGVIIADYVAIDGDERTKEIQYTLVQDVDQATQLATYDVCDAREAGPGTVPLGPFWLNYRIGDCVTFNPEDGFSIKCLITGLDLDPQTGTVTYTLISETDGKHAFALGATGTAPPTASIVYTDDVAAPLAANWTAQGAQLSNLGTSTPVIAVSGAVDNGSADAVILEYRVSQVLGTADGSDLTTAAGDTIEVSAPGPWLQAGIFAPTVTGMQIAQVASGETYDVAISYRVRGVIGAQLIIPSVQAGLMVTPGSLASLIATSAPSSALSMTAAADTNGTTATISISAHQRVYSDKTVNVNAGSVGGLALSTDYVVFYDDAARAGGAVTYQASTNPDDALITSTTPARHYVGAVTTPAAGSTSTSSGTTATGAGGLSTTTGTKKQQV